MAGFQKFPTPRAVHASFWNYNPRWKACALAYGIGCSLVAFVVFRYSLLRSSTKPGYGSFYTMDQQNRPRPVQL